jgi:hypothetical protein
VAVVTVVANPALERFIAQMDDERVLAQVIIRRVERGYELRHEADRGRAAAALRLVPVAELRVLAQSTANGAFRPLKSAPNLQTGWRASPANQGELEAALHLLYPGAIADWLAAQEKSPPVTHFREFTERQTGMYRITTMLDDHQAEQVTTACCHRRFCLKRRLWTVGALKPDTVAEKSVIPCLEPCAILLEFARKAMRLEQDEKLPLPVGAQDLETRRAALQTALAAPSAAEREADFESPLNPRRLQLALEKLKTQPAKSRALER